MSGRQRTPDWLVERIALGELPQAELAAARQQLESEPDGPARLAAIEASNREILAAHPAPAMAERIRERTAEAAGARWSRWQLGALFAAPALAAAAALVFWLGPGPGDDIRLKGLRSHLVLHRTTDGQVEPLADRAPAHAGDRIQISYLAAGKKFGAVLSIDGRGNLTHHLAAPGPAPAQLTAAGEIALLSSFELDDAPDFERFILVACDKPYDQERLIEEVHRVAAGAAPMTEPLTGLDSGCEQSSLVLTKVAP